MTIPEAIQELQDSLDERIPSLRKRRQNALQLGIEALKKIAGQRVPNGTLDFFRLPGETKE